MVVEQASCAAGFAGDRPPGEPAWPLADQDALGGLEELLAETGDRDAAG